MTRELERTEGGSLSLYSKFVHRYARLPTENDPDYLEMLCMSKYRILSLPDAVPSRCANCGSMKNDDRSYVDFGLYIDWYGVVFLCTLCLTDISRNAGLYKSLELQISDLESRLKQLESFEIKGEELKETLVRTFEEVNQYFVQLDNLNGSSTDSVVTDGGNSNLGTESNERSRSGSDETKPVVDKPSHRSRPKNIRSLTNLLDSGPDA